MKIDSNSQLIPQKNTYTPSSESSQPNTYSKLTKITTIHRKFHPIYILSDSLQKIKKANSTEKMVMIPFIPIVSMANPIKSLLNHHEIPLNHHEIPDPMKHHH